MVDTPDGPVVVYGTVLPWANDPGVDGQARMWQEHEAAIIRQGEQWRTLRRDHPDGPLVVAGDLNQDRDGSGWYGTRRGRKLLSEAFDAAGLICVTAEDVLAAGKLRCHHLVDHIAVCSRWAAAAEVVVHCWEAQDDDGVRLSDHPTVAIDIGPAGASVEG